MANAVQPTTTSQTPKLQTVNISYLIISLGAIAFETDLHSHSSMLFYKFTLLH